ncbi:hypothetical protein MKX01_016986 [Papaver californicum]|nr:hypothetical protein MKX01_016986 [Papaver californicum]
MDRLLKQYDKELVRTKMLKQEEICKEQVNPDHQPRVWATCTVFETNNCSFTNTNNSGHNFHQFFSVRTEPINLLEQSGTSCSRDNVKMHKDFDLESSAEEFSRNIGRDQICSSSTTSSKGKMKVKRLNEQHLYTKGEAEVELTLSIGFGCSLPTVF